MSNEHCAMGLNKKGVTIFVILLICMWPICWLPWVMKDTKAEKPGQAPDPKAEAKPAKVTDSIIVKFGIFMGGIIVFSIVLIGGLNMAGIDTKKMIEEDRARLSKASVEFDESQEYAKGYRAGYAYTKDTGKILTEKGPNFEGRLEQMNKSMGNVANGVESLANDYGGNKSQAWKDGCKEGYLDGLRGAKEKH